MRISRFLKTHWRSVKAGHQLKYTAIILLTLLRIYDKLVIEMIVSVITNTQVSVMYRYKCELVYVPWQTPINNRKKVNYLSLVRLLSYQSQSHIHLRYVKFLRWFSLWFIFKTRFVGQALWGNLNILKHIDMTLYNWNTTMGLDINTKLLAQS